MLSVIGNVTSSSVFGRCWLHLLVLTMLLLFFVGLRLKKILNRVFNDRVCYQLQLLSVLFLIHVLLISLNSIRFEFDRCREILHDKLIIKYHGLI